jgi:hypothetical protein
MKLVSVVSLLTTGGSISLNPNLMVLEDRFERPICDTIDGVVRLSKDFRWSCSQRLFNSETSSDVVRLTLSPENKQFES